MRASRGSSHLMGEFFQGRVRRPSYLLRQDEDGSGGKDGAWEKV